MSKHTPGPWVAVSPVDPGEWSIQAPNAPRGVFGDPVNVVSTSEWGGVWEEADAKLIAAAPDLLAACKAALGAFEHRHAINWDDLAQAIAKAEGTAL